MNEVAMIDEIAKQLGMTTEQVSGHVAELWPMYVSGIQAQKVSPMIVALSLGIILPVLLAVACFMYNKRSDYQNDDVIFAFLIVIAIWVVFGIIVSFATSMSGLPYLINPEGAALTNLVDILKG